MPVMAVEMKDITKTFGKLSANENVNLDIRQGEIHALLGENGAGKSTLMNILSGIYQPTRGEIYLGKKKVKFSSPRDALDYGIGMIYQHFKLAESMTALENIVEANNSGFFLSRKKGRMRIKALCDSTGLSIDPDKYVYNMSISEKQTLEILKVLYCDVNVLILDEPTAVLTPQETDKLFEIIYNMKMMGHSIIIITHKLNEIMKISDRVTVLRGGRNVITVNTKDTNPQILTQMMVGESIEFKNSCAPRLTNEKYIELKDISLTDSGISILDGISFDICGGEILGVAGLAGSGQKPLCEIVAGLEKISSGDILYRGESVISKKTGDVDTEKMRAGFVPENRLGMGLVGSMDMVDNLLLREESRQKGIIIKRKEAEEHCNRLIEEMEIKTQGISYPVKMMSGGNIQKVMVGREIMRDIDVFVAAYPVRGLDMSSIHFVYHMIEEIKLKGIPVLLIGEDLDHLIEFTNRIMVMCEGKIMGIVNSSNTSREELGEMMAGRDLPKERWAK